MRLVYKYVSLCPDVGKSKKYNFYLRSLEKPNPAQWYGDQLVGKNSLIKVVGKMLKNAKLDRYFTNHSLKHMSVTRLFQAGIDLKRVKEVTGHVSNTVNKYQVTSNKQRMEISDVLKCKMNEKEVEDEVKTELKTEPPVPSLEVSLMNSSPNNGIKCSCKQKSFDLNNENLTSMISELVSKCTSGKAKIKLEIELSN